MANQQIDVCVCSSYDFCKGEDDMNDRHVLKTFLWTETKDINSLTQNHHNKMHNHIGKT